MKITRYGITLEKLCEDKIELVRIWRNDSKIAQFMFHKGTITETMQREWFASINNSQNFFFLIYNHEQPVGLINMSSIDWENQTAFAGLFIYEDAYLGTDVPVLASLNMLDFFLLGCGIKQVFAKVRGNNAIAHRYNTSLGFKRTKKIEFGQGYEYLLFQENYLTEAQNLRQYAKKLKGNTTQLEWLINDAIDSLMQAKIGSVTMEVKTELGIKF